MSIWILMTVLSLNYAVTSAREFCYSDGEYNYYCNDPKICCPDNTGCCTPSSSGLSDTAIAGIVTGGIAFLILLCCIGCICKCCKGKCCDSNRVVPPLDVERAAQHGQDESYTVQRIQTVDNAPTNQRNYNPYRPWAGDW